MPDVRVEVDADTEEALQVECELLGFDAPAAYLAWIVENRAAIEQGTESAELLAAYRERLATLEARLEADGIDPGGIDPGGVDPESELSSPSTSETPSQSDPSQSDSPQSDPSRSDSTTQTGLSTEPDRSTSDEGDRDAVTSAARSNSGVDSPASSSATDGPSERATADERSDTGATASPQPGDDSTSEAVPDERSADDPSVDEPSPEESSTEARVDGPGGIDDATPEAFDDAASAPDSETIEDLDDASADSPDDETTDAPDAEAANAPDDATTATVTASDGGTRTDVDVTSMHLRPERVQRVNEDPVARDAGELSNVATKRVDEFSRRAVAETRQQLDRDVETGLSYDSSAAMSSDVRPGEDLADLDDIDVPGRSEDVVAERQAVVGRALAHLRDEGSARRSAFVDELYEAHPAGYETADSWWRCVREGLSQVEAVDGGHVWEYVD